MREMHDLTGMRFENLTVLCRSDRRLSGNVQWLCRCDCGSKLIVRGDNLITGHSTRCSLCKPRGGKMSVFVDSEEKQQTNIKTKEKFKMEKEMYIVRARDAGVFFGEIAERSHDEVTMTNVRKLWYWKGACAVEQLALEGVKNPDSCQFTVEVPHMIISDPIQIIKASEMACNSIKAVPVWKI